MPRVSRAATARNYQSRKASQREAIQTENQGVLHVDPRRIPEDKEYAWVRRAVLNQEDALNIRTRQMQGWKPVPADRHPELTTEGWGLPGETVKAYIEVAGLILCECPKREATKRKLLQREEALDAIDLKHLAEGDKQARDLPVFNESEDYLETISSPRKERRGSDSAEFKE